MSYETVSEIRNKNLHGILTDISDIIDLPKDQSDSCFNYFNNLILRDLWNCKVYDNHKDQKSWEPFGDDLENRESRPIDCWIAGGSLRNFFSTKPLNCDVDIYFASAIDFQSADFFMKNILYGKEIFDNKNCRKINLDGIVFDLIKIYYTDPKVCISDFDFTVCSCAVTRNGVISHKDFLWDLLNSNLKTLSPNPETIEFRTEKYKNLGFYGS